MGKLTINKKFTLIICSIISAIVLFGIFCVILLVDVFHIPGDTLERHSLWRQKSRDVIASVESGLSREQVVKVAKEHGFTESSIDRRDSEIRLYTPSEPFASNWVIRFGFSDNKLIYVKVGTMDEVEYRPKDAPEDIVYSRDINDTG